MRSNGCATGWHPLSSSATYALHAVLAIATSPQGMPADEVARELGIPAKYLSKVLNTLAHAGVLNSTRGRTGGFRLAVSAEALRLSEVIGPFDAVRGVPRCLLRSMSCDPAHPCLAHEEWKEAAQRVHEFFRVRTVADVLASAPSSAFEQLAGAIGGEVVAAAQTGL